MPDIDFYVRNDGVGSVSGTVTCNGSGLGGVDLQVQNSNLRTVSNEDGSYEFPQVNACSDGVILASKHGYNDTNSEVFSVTGGQVTSDVNIEIVQEPVINLSGKILSNVDNSAIVANIDIDGYENYDIQTDDLGEFNLPIYANHEYNLRIFAEGFQTYYSQINVESSDIVLEDIILNECTYLAHNVQAHINDENIDVSWNSATAINDFWLTKSAIDSPVSIGANGNQVFNAAHEYTANEISPYIGAYVKRIKFFPKIAEAQYTAKVWDLEGNELGSQLVEDIEIDNWNEVELYHGVKIPANGIRIGYEVVANFGYCCGADAGPTVPGGDVYSLNGGNWSELHVDSPTLNINFSIQGYIVNSRGETMNLVKGKNVENNRELISYNVYRYNVEDADNQEEWTLVGNTTELTFTDNNWSDLDDGFYKWAVCGLYSGDIESDALASNFVNHTSDKSVTFNITSNIDHLGLDGVNVELTGQTLDPSGNTLEYEIVSNTEGIATAEVVKDTYNYVVTATNHVPLFGTVDLTTTDQIVNLEMEEFAAPVNNVQAEVEEDNVNISWGLPGVAGPCVWLQKCADIESTQNGIGANGPADMICCMGYSQSDLAQYSGQYINKVSFMPNSLEGSFAIVIYNDNDLLYTQEIEFSDLTEKAWNEIMLTTPVRLPSSGMTYIGYHVEATAGHPAGVDHGPMVANGAMCKFNGSPWQTLTEVAQNADFNWIIKAMISPATSVRNQVENVLHTTEFTLEKAVVPSYNNQFSAEFMESDVVMSDKENSRALSGYKVYRLTAEEENIENWTLLTDTDLASDVMTYSDNEWSSLDAGSYQYAVLATYPTGDSYPIISNVIEKDVTGNLEVIVTNDLGDFIEGAVISCGELSATTNSQGHYVFENIHAQSYHVIVNCDGYNEASEDVTVEIGETAVAAFRLEISTVMFADGFESYQNFEKDSIGDWTLTDVDALETYGIENVSFPHAGEAMSFIVWNGNATTPAIGEYVSAISDNKSLASFASREGDNNDWLISKEFEVGSECTLSFKAKSQTDEFGLERMKVLVSSTGTATDDFTVISGDSHISVPAETTQYDYDLSDYEGQNIRFAINCVSSNSFMLMIDDIAVNGNLNTENNVNPVVNTSLGDNYPNPFNPETTIRYNMKNEGNVAIEIYNLKGQRVKTLVNENQAAGTHTIVWNGMNNHNTRVSSGIYFYRMKTDGYSNTKKMILLK